MNIALEGKRDEEEEQKETEEEHDKVTNELAAAASSGTLGRADPAVAETAECVQFELPALCLPWGQDHRDKERRKREKKKTRGRWSSTAC